MKKLSLFSLLFLFCIGLAAQQNTTSPTDTAKIKKVVKYNPKLIQKEKELQALFNKIIKEDTRDSDRISINEKIRVKLAEALKDSGSFVYPFDSLKNLGKIYSNDLNIRVYTWSCEMEDYSMRFYGIIHDYINDKVYPLVQNGPVFIPDATKQYMLNRWYGALYYKAINISKKGADPKYILLGWSQLAPEPKPIANTLVSANELPDSGVIDLKQNLPKTKLKVMEVLTFDDEKVLLGDKVFKGYKGKANRIVFTYCSDLNMSLSYDEVNKQFIFDHLTPLVDDRGNSRGCNGPDMSYDSLKQKRKRWVLKKDIDAKNNK